MRCLAEIQLYRDARLDCDRRENHEGPHRDSTHLVLWTDQMEWPAAECQHVPDAA
ncbi:hypothetical protein MRBLMI12_000517 [Microbacterium sp. LMI12-1-1.1]|uniref:hypothetical protein n=1 Tax=Microbacterium sp. LMI12-1-1.1 TaxID=3135225 RepID=UPI003435499C